LELARRLFACHATNSPRFISGRPTVTRSSARSSSLGPRFVPSVFALSTSPQSRDVTTELQKSHGPSPHPT
jgi:hypothetical protein